MINYLIVGLGNPGKEYENTRHNAGFLLIDEICKKYSISCEKEKFKSLICETEIKNKKVILCKPQTFMNLSGSAVFEISNFYKIKPENTIVVSDEISLDIGNISTKPGTNGHNGLKNIIKLLNSNNIRNIKIGVGKKPSEYDLSNWVLSKIPKEQKEEFTKSLKEAIKIIERILET